MRAIIIAIVLCSCGSNDAYTHERKELEKRAAALKHYENCLDMQVRLMEAGLSQEQAAIKVDEITKDDIPCHCVDSL